MTEQTIATETVAQETAPQAPQVTAEETHYVVTMPEVQSPAELVKAWVETAEKGEGNTEFLTRLGAANKDAVIPKVDDNGAALPENTRNKLWTNYRQNRLNKLGDKDTAIAKSISRQIKLANDTIKKLSPEQTEELAKLQQRKSAAEKTYNLVSQPLPGSKRAGRNIDEEMDSFFDSLIG